MNSGLPIDSGEPVNWSRLCDGGAVDQNGNLVVPYGTWRNQTFASRLDKATRQWRLFAFGASAESGEGLWSADPGQLGVDLTEREYSSNSGLGTMGVNLALVSGDGFAPYLFGIFAGRRLSGTLPADDHGQSLGLYFDGASKWRKWTPGVSVTTGLPNETRITGDWVVPYPSAMWGSGMVTAFAYNPLTPMENTQARGAGTGFIGHHPDAVSKPTAALAVRYYPPTAPV